MTSYNLAAAIGGRIHEGAQRGLLEAGRALEAEAAARAPVDQEALRSNTSVQLDGDNRVQVGFHQVYAARQHEETGWNHPRGGEAGYLANAADAQQTQLSQTIANHIAGSIR